MVEFLSKVWCRKMHTRMYRPVHGHYTCAVCLRQWPVPWEHPAREDERLPMLSVKAPREVQAARGA